MKALAARFETQLEELVSHTVALSQAQIREFAGFAVPELVPGTIAVYEQGVAALPELREPEPDELAVIERMAAVRAEQGISVDAYLAGFRLTGGEMLVASERFTVELELSAATVIAFHRHLWAWSDLAMRCAASAHRSTVESLAVRPRRNVDGLLVELLNGQLSLPEIAGLATTWGLHASSSVRAVRIRGKASRWAFGGALVEHEGDLCGFVPVNTVLPDDLRAGVSDAVAVCHLDRGFAQAGEALAAATHFGRRGPVTLADVALEAGVLRNHDLGEALARRLLPEPEAHDDLERTVWCWLGARCEIGEAARELYVHPNTVRYRLRRFAELSGLDLDSPRVRAELWWALAHRRSTH